MKLGYIQTFAELTQNKNIVSEQELMAFQNKYNLAEKEMDEIKEYCIEHDIMVFYAEDFDVKDVSHRIQTAGTYPSQDGTSQDYPYYCERNRA